MSGPAGARKVDAGSRKGPTRSHDDIGAQVLEAGAIPTAERDDQVRRLLRDAGDRPMPHARGAQGRRRLLGKAAEGDEGSVGAEPEGRSAGAEPAMRDEEE